MIFTFYSYKGGVGRSMALANVAEYLYRKGLRVVMVDWDLEAPGLESFYFNPREEQGQETLKKIRSQLGLIDMLLAYKDQYPSLFRADRRRITELDESDNESVDTANLEQKTELAEQIDLLKKNLPSIQTHLYPVHPPGSLEDDPQAALFLMQAGWREGDRFGAYSRAIQSFDWTDFYRSYRGKAFFEWMRQELEELADVVLVDSRTGVTEMGGVCTRQLADVVVSCSVLNSQNMEGVARMMKSFNREEVMLSRDGRTIDNIVVPMRIDTQEIDARAKLIEVFDNTMGEVPIQFSQVNTTYWKLGIPYVGKYAYFERLAIGATDRAYELQNAYKSLAAHLALFAIEGSPLRTKLSKELGELFRITTRAPIMAPPLPPAFVERPLEIDALKKSFAISSGDSGGKIIALCGVPGAGKSVMAAAFSREADVMGVFKDGILWVTLGAKPNMKEALAGLYTNLTGDARTFESENEAKRYLVKQLDKNCLIVIDDLCSTEDFKVFKDFGDQYSFLITTRDRGLAVSLEARQLQVEELSPQQALELVTALSKLSSEYQEVLSTFVRRLGGQPLLLKLAGDTLRQRIEFVGDSPLNALEYANRLFTEKGAVAFDKADTSDRNQAVARSVGASLDLLSDEELERYIQLALVLDKKEMSITEVMQLWKVQDDKTEALHDQLKTEEMLQRLNALSLVDYDQTAQKVRLDGLLRSHLLAQLPSNVGLNLKAESIFTKFTPEEQSAAQQVLTRLVKLGHDAGGDTRARVRLSSLDDSARRIVATLTEAGIVVIEEDTMIKQQKVLLADESLIKKWPRLREWIESDREFLLWLQQIRPGFEAWKADHNYGLLWGEELAVAKQWMNKRPGLDQAVWAYVTVSAENNRKQWWKRVGIISILGFIISALVLSAVWRWNVNRKAKEELEQRQQLAVSKYQQGLAASGRNDYANAISLFNDALQAAPDRIEFYNARGNVYSLQGNYSAAINDFNQVLINDPNSAEAYFNRALTWQRSGDKSQALSDFTNVLRLTKDAKISDTTYAQIRDLYRVSPNERNVGWAQYVSWSEKDRAFTIRNFLKNSGNPNSDPQVGDQLTSLSTVNLREVYAEQNSDGQWVFPTVTAVLQPQQTSIVLDVHAVNNNGTWVKIKSNPSQSTSVRSSQPKVTLYYSGQGKISVLVDALSNEGYDVMIRRPPVPGVKPEVRYYHSEDKESALTVIGIINKMVGLRVGLNSRLSDPIAVKTHPLGTIEVWLN